MVLVVLGLLFAGCASSNGSKVLRPELVEGMDPEAVAEVWGEPSSVLEYDDSLGHHVRWEYYRTAVLESMYWSIEPRYTPQGMTSEAVYRGRPYSQRYLAGWVVFREGALVRWQAYPYPTAKSSTLSTY